MSYYNRQFDAMDMEETVESYERMIDRFKETASDIFAAGLSRCIRGDGETVDCVFIMRNEGDLELHEVDIE